MNFNMRARRSCRSHPVARRWRRDLEPIRRPRSRDREPRVQHARLRGGSREAQRLRRPHVRRERHDAIHDELVRGPNGIERYDQRGIPHLSGIWNGRVYDDEPVSPGERSAGHARAKRRFVHVPKTRHGCGPARQLERGRGRVTTSSTAGRCSSESTRISPRTGRMQARLQRGATTLTRRCTTKIASTANSSRSTPWRCTATARDLNGDGILGLVTEADRGTGQIICNVQRYNPTPAQLQAGRCGPAFPAADRRHEPRRSHRPRADPGPGRSGRNPELRADERLRSGQRESSRARLRRIAERKRRHGQPGVRRDPVHRRHLERIRAGAFSMAGGLTYREQSFWQIGLAARDRVLRPAAERPVSSAFAASPAASRRAARICTSSRPSRRSRATTTSGRCSRSSICRSGSRNSGNQRFELDLAGRHSDYSTSGGIVSHKTGLNFQVADRLGAARYGFARRPRADFRRALQPPRRRRHGRATRRCLRSAAGADHGDERR